jgi:hypothetical protein
MSNELKFELCGFKSISVKKSTQNYIISIEFLDGGVKSYILDNELSVVFKLKRSEDK